VHAQGGGGETLSPAWMLLLASPARRTAGGSLHGSKGTRGDTSWRLSWSQPASLLAGKRFFNHTLFTERGMSETENLVKVGSTTSYRGSQRVAGARRLKKCGSDFPERDVAEQNPPALPKQRDDRWRSERNLRWGMGAHLGRSSPRSHAGQCRHERANAAD